MKILRYKLQPTDFAFMCPVNFGFSLWIHALCSAFCGPNKVSSSTNGSCGLLLRIYHRPPRHFPANKRINYYILCTIYRNTCVISVTVLFERLCTKRRLLFYIAVNYLAFLQWYNCVRAGSVQGENNWEKKKIYCNASNRA